MELKQRLTAYILKTAPVTMDTLIAKATEQGYSELEVLTALEQVHRDKRINQTANTAGVVTYKLAISKNTILSKEEMDKDYPEMDETNNGSHSAFALLDYSYLLLSPSEVEEYKSGGRYTKKRYAK